MLSYFHQHDADAPAANPNPFSSRLPGLPSTASPAVELPRLPGRGRREMRKTIRSYTIHCLPACQDWKGSSYPKRYGVTLTTTGNPMRIDGGEYATREEAVAAGEQAAA